MDFGWGNMNYGGGMGMRMGMGTPMRFEEQYHCYSMAYAEKAHLEVSESIRNIRSKRRIRWFDFDFEFQHLNIFIFQKNYHEHPLKTD